MASAFVRSFCRNFLLFLVNITWPFLTTLAAFLKRRQISRQNRPNASPPLNPGGVGAGKVVLVTTGRQAKTLHTIRALKAVGATVIVTDYSPISASALSLACDKFIVLPPLVPGATQAWIDHFRTLLVANKVDVVLPVSTINEVLFLGLAQQQLARQLPHIRWLCPDLDNALLFDDRTRFAACCDAFGVPHPEHGHLVSAAAVPGIAANFTHGIILKRIESTVNRDEEIVRVRPGESLPAHLNPTPADPWQWQRFIQGAEFSAWYVCVDGKVTFCSCYHSSPDLVAFDPAPVSEHVDKPLRLLISSLGLSGQFAFDYMTDHTSGRSYVFECNPRASSVLETVSTTSAWGEAFFGVDVSKRTMYSSVGFLYHRNCWPWANRSDGFFDLTDPLPFFAAELVWPMNAIATKGLSENMYRAIDVNIGKIILDGQSPGRDIAVFRDELDMHKLSIALEAVQHMDTVFLDASLPKLGLTIKRCSKMGVYLILLHHENNPVPSEAADCDDVVSVADKDHMDEVMDELKHGETRILLGPTLSQLGGASSDMSYRIVSSHGNTWLPKYEIPLRTLRLLHVMGSNVSQFYETLSSTYGYKCIANLGTTGRFDHYVAYIHPSGQWSVGPYKSDTFATEGADRLSTGEAIQELELMGIDCVVPHMFDYDGMTAFRALFSIVKIPLIGCSAEALALSASKSRTNACAHVAGIQVPPFEVIRRGMKPTIALPFVVKPSEEDNSQGIRVVYNEDEVEEALEAAFEFCDDVLCEQFIVPGRELRVGLVEAADGTLEMLPAIEYIVSEDDPVRTKNHKLGLTDSGRVLKLAGGAPGGVILPAILDDSLREKLYAMLCKAHKALGCRDYSIYDLRIDPSGVPYMLETCLYCSFADCSVLVKMQASDGVSKSQLFNRLCERTLSRRVIVNQTKEGTRMRVRC